MKKRNAELLMLMGVMGMLTGCGNTIPEMTSEQQGLVVEYAVSTVLKYDRNYENRLITVSELAAEEEQLSEEAPDQNAEQNTEIQEQGSELPELSQTTASEGDAPKGTDAEQGADATSIEEFLQTEQLTFRYTGFEVVDQYPERNEEEELFFAMTATEGQKLLVIRFDVENSSGTDADLDMNGMGVRFRLVVDGEEKRTLTTMLLNDLSYYSGTIASGETKELVLVCELPEEKAQTVSELKLVMKNVDNTATISLN